MGFCVPFPFSFVIKVCAKIENTLPKGDSVITLHLFVALDTVVSMYSICKKKIEKGTVRHIMHMCEFVPVYMILFTFVLFD